MVIGIIGGGASGMAAAIAAAQNPGNQIILLERQARLGRKLQATGNGRCNLSNVHAGLAHYHGENPAFVEPALARFSVDQTLAWFKELGLFTVTEDSGKVYPYSDQANSVLDVLRFALERENITVTCGFEVERVRRSGNGFLIRGGDEEIYCEKLIVACGGIAGSKLGGTMSGYQILRSFGHRATKLRPSLVQIKSDWSGCVALKGVRANCHIEILKNGAHFAESTGELQLTEQGLSGPVVFEISRDVCHGGGDWTATLDFLPDISRENLLEELKRRQKSRLNSEELLTGILHNRLGRVLTKAVGIAPNCPIGELTAGGLDAVCRAVKAFSVHLTEPLGMDSAQVTAGGILTADFDENTMESRKVPGLYACGEVLDIDGDCGGYNLQWAWSSGRLAGESAGKL